MPGLIFDFDGLVVETESVEFAVYRQVLSGRGVNVDPADFLRFIGTNDEEGWIALLREWLGHDVDLDAFEAQAREIRRPLTLAAPVLDGVIELLDDAHAAGWRIGLGSSSPRRWIDMHLSHRGLLERFDAIVTRDDVERVKPDPDIFVEVARRLGLDPSECVVLEDSEHGCRAAKAAGMAVIACPNEMTRAADFSVADRVVVSLLEVKLSGLLDC